MVPRDMWKKNIGESNRRPESRGITGMTGGSSVHRMIRQCHEEHMMLTLEMVQRTRRTKTQETSSGIDGQDNASFIQVRRRASR